MTINRYLSRAMHIKGHPVVSEVARTAHAVGAYGDRLLGISARKLQSKAEVASAMQRRLHAGHLDKALGSPKPVINSYERRAMKTGDNMAVDLRTGTNQYLTRVQNMAREAAEDSHKTRKRTAVVASAGGLTTIALKGDGSYNSSPGYQYTYPDSGIPY